MTQQEIVAHWRKGARESLRLAELAQQEGSFALALFHCHLAVEKALKALYIQQYDDNPPKTHDLLQLVKKLSLSLSDQQRELLDELSDFVTLARYSDLDWESVTATEDTAKHWLKIAGEFISTFHSL